ncbi:MAG TPA: S46 family peptidase [Gemmataceae bacterium]|nr:S46 family peptidase [Gemmataceae bacterium]
MRRSDLLLGVLALAMTVPAAEAPADEGLWLFNNPPKKQLKEKYGFDAGPEWYDHVMRSSVRFNSGGSGSFVSANGLVMTNHHVGADALQKMSDEKHNYLADGFYAKTSAEEKKCLDLELNVLEEIVDVTKEVEGAVKPDMSAEDAFKARRSVMAKIEKESQEKTGLRSNVITLYQGGQYHLYRYKRYTDVRLVFAPEQQIAFFGGDPDNFEYPRYDLDICFFRVYENDKPLQAKHYFKWSAHGAGDNELVFVSGNPGRTDRQNTMAELAYLRDFGYPFVLQRLNRMEVALMSWSQRSEENARRARDELFGVQNSRKARDGGLAGLLDPALMARKQAEEEKLRKAVASNPELKSAADAWDRIAKAETKRREVAKDFLMYEGRSGFNSQLFGVARTLLRAAEEFPKPNGERLREFVDSNKEPMKFQLFSEEPIYDDLEILTLTDSLTLLCYQYGEKDEMVKKVLGGKSPHDRAAELVLGSKLKDVELRKKLFEGGQQAVDACKDPMVELARLIDPISRKVRKIMDTEVDEVKRQAHSQIAKSKYALEGDSVYPDATFTLRLSYGAVKGYEENGKQIPFETNFHGLYERSAQMKNKPPFDLPPRWEKQKDKLTLSTPLNFVFTADIIGGNSGSPVINKNAELVGIVFDGNIQSLVWDFIFDEKEGRSLAVHSAGIVEALRKVYEAQDLANELTGK